VAQRPRHRRTALFAALAAVALTVIAAAPAVTRIRLRARIPPLPDAASLPQPVRSHLETERRAALDDVSNPAAVGRYCIALHADLLFDEAQRCYAFLEQRDPGRWQWSYDRALILDETGGGPPLVEALRRVTSAAPGFGPAWWRLGEAEFKLGRYDEAAGAWGNAVSAREPDRSAEAPPHKADIPLSAYARFGLARISLLEGDAEGARQILEAAIALGPLFGNAYRLLAEADRALQRNAEATAALARAGRLLQYAPYADPMIETLARVSRNSTFLLRQASDADVSVNAAWIEFLVRRALEFDPDNPDAIAKLGRTLRTLGRNGEALPVLRAYHEKVPGDLQGLAQVGTCLIDLGRFDEAERVLREALTGLDDAETHYNLGLVLARTDRLRDAIDEYKKAVARDPSLLSARNNLAAAYARQGRLPEAAAELRKVLAADPDNAIARANLAIVRGGAQ
jgi:tetratricopeptide (TPR) repeat protein